MNLSYRQLKAFVAVAYLKNFTRAAENLHMTQQGLSLMIQQLEKQLGSRLFERTTRSIALSSAGRQLLTVAEDVIARLENAVLSIEQLSRQVARRLSVAATPFVASHLLPEVCRRMARVNPELKVKVVDTERDRIPKLVESGEVDLGLGIFFRPMAGLHRRRLFECELICVEPRADMSDADAPAKSPECVKWEDLVREQLIGLAPDNPLQQWVDLHLARVGQLEPDRQTYNHIPTLLFMVEQGMGKAVLPSFTLAACERMRIQARPVRDPRVTVNFYQLSAKGRHRSPAESEFLRALLAVMQERCMFPPVHEKR